jgi:hypothetical protein
MARHGFGWPWSHALPLSCCNKADSHFLVLSLFIFFLVHGGQEGSKQGDHIFQSCFLLSTCGEALSFFLQASQGGEGEKCCNLKLISRGGSHHVLQPGDYYQQETDTLQMYLYFFMLHACFTPIVLCFCLHFVAFLCIFWN